MPARPPLYQPLETHKSDSDSDSAAGGDPEGIPLAVALLVAAAAAAAIVAATIVAVAAAAAAAPRSPEDEGSWRSCLLLVSIDGFRPDYADRSLTPNLNLIASRGVRAASMAPSFPSVTFPNHYTLVTGLHPESHGIVGNVFYDPSSGKNFSYTDPDMNGDGYWWSRAEPIWATAIKQGKRAATCMWPGSEAEINGIRPTHWLKYNWSMSMDEKIDHVLSWIDLPVQQRPSFISLYLPDVDSAGHTGGSDSDNVTAALQTVDAAIGRLYTSLSDRHIAHLINLVIVSDHGMADTAPDRVVFLDDYINITTIWTITNGPIIGIYPISTTNTNMTTVFHLLDAGAQRHGNFSVYRHDYAPQAYHYTASDRIAPVTIVAHLGWTVIESQTGYNTSSPPFPKGLHGYNNTDPHMRALFIAHGSAFKSPSDHGVIPSFHNTQVYQMLCRVLGIVPRANNGTVQWLDSFVNGWMSKS